MEPTVLNYFGDCLWTDGQDSIIIEYQFLFLEPIRRADLHIISNFLICSVEFGYKTHRNRGVPS